MPIGPIQLLRQAITEQRRTLLTPVPCWTLDVFDAMLYAFVQAHLMPLGLFDATQLPETRGGI